MDAHTSGVPSQLRPHSLCFSPRRSQVLSGFGIRQAEAHTPRCNDKMIIDGQSLSLCTLLSPRNTVSVAEPRTRNEEAI